MNIGLSKQNTVIYSEFNNFKYTALYANEKSDVLIDGIPESFVWKGYNIKYDAVSNCYNITIDNNIVSFTEKDILILNNNKIDIIPRIKFVENNICNGGFSFGEAIKLLRQGCDVSRVAWQCRRNYLLLGGDKTSSENTVLTYDSKRNKYIRDYYHEATILIVDAEDHIKPYFASNEDILATDWYVHS